MYLVALGKSHSWRILILYVFVNRKLLKEADGDSFQRRMNIRTNLSEAYRHGNPIDQLHHLSISLINEISSYVEYYLVENFVFLSQTKK